MKDQLRMALKQIYSECEDLEELDIRRKEIVSLTEKTYQLELSYRTDMEDFENDKKHF